MTTFDTAGRGFPRLALASAWFLTTVAVGVLGIVRSEPVLVAIAILALIATVAVTSNRLRDWTLRYSGAASAALIVAGLVAGNGVIAVIAGIVTARLSWRAWVMSR